MSRPKKMIRVVCTSNDLRKLSDAVRLRLEATVRLSPPVLEGLEVGREYEVWALERWKGREGR